MTTVETGETSLTMRQTFDAPREYVFHAFADPDDLEQWFAPGTLTTEVHALEPEPSDELSLSFVDGANRTTIRRTYLEVAENERIVHTWNYLREEESHVTYAFQDADGGTEVGLIHENIGPYRERSARENVDRYAEGWPIALDKLEAVLREDRR